VKATVVGGLQVGLGYAGVNALRAIEGRFGLDGIMSRLPGGMIGRVAEYAVKFVNANLAATIAGMFGRGFAGHVKTGGFANIGVSLLADVAGMSPVGGDLVTPYLHGVGNYNLAYNMGQAMPSLGNYNLATGGQAINSVSGDEVYPKLDSIYG
jgi:hypothetical protein